MTDAKIIADSISPEGNRITTMQIKFHRFVLAEFNTHRRFSRNFSSSRAIPTKKLLDQVRNNPAMPLWWGKNQSGMQAPEELDDHTKAGAIIQWKRAADQAAFMAHSLADIGVHKQIVNRLIEPFLYVEGIVTSTDWQNFFDLRCHPDAQPEIQALAYKMRDVLNASTPTPLDHGDWHIPYISSDDHFTIDDHYEELGRPATFSLWEELAKVSAARCCRVSYLKHDGTTATIKEELALFDKLAGGVPIHASPLEHQARCVPECDSSLSRNFSGWVQFRALWERSLV